MHVACWGLCHMAPKQSVNISAVRWQCIVWAWKMDRVIARSSEDFRSPTNIETDVEMTTELCNPPHDYQMCETGEFGNEVVSDIDMRSHQWHRMRCKRSNCVRSSVVRCCYCERRQMLGSHPDATQYLFSFQSYWITLLHISICGLIP